MGSREGKEKNMNLNHYLETRLSTVLSTHHKRNNKVGPGKKKKFFFFLRQATNWEKISKNF